MHCNRRAFLETAAGTACASLLLGDRALHAAAPAPLRIDVRTYGALGDGVANDTQAIQRAIDDASAHGSAVVFVPPGRYVTGTLLLGSGVTLELDAAATLLGSLDPSHYRLVEPFTDGVGTLRGYALLACVEASRVSVKGGTIDGRGAALQASAGAGGAKLAAAKPFLVLCVRSSAISFTGVRLQNSAAWTMHLFQCSGVAVEDVSLRSVGLANNDGIDIDSSSDVRISGCTIDSGDDAICLKTTSTRATTGIEITDCTMTTRCAAFKIGTESLADFSGIRVARCHVVRADLGAIKLLSVDGAHISDVLVENMTVDDADTPIFVRLGARGKVFRAGDAPRPAGSISGIVLRDIRVARARRIGVLLSGVPGHPIDSVTLERVAITMAGEPAKRVPEDPPEAAAAYPEVRMFGAELPASGVYARHVRLLKQSSTTVTAVTGDVRPVSKIEPAEPL